MLNEIDILRERGVEVSQICFDESMPNSFGHGIYNYNFKSRLRRKIGKFIGSILIRRFINNAIENIKPDYIHIHLMSKYPVEVLKAVEGFNVTKTLHGPNLFCASSWGGLKNGEKCELGIGVKCYKRNCVSLFNTFCYMYLQTRYKKLLVNNITKFLCPSNFIKNAALNYGIKNVEYAPLFVKDVFNKSPLKVNGSRYELLYVGAIDIVKGIDMIIEAIRVLNKSRNDIHVTIIGSGSYQKQLIDLISEYDLINVISYIGPIDNNKINTYFYNADVFLMPSLWQEQFGLVGIEALLSKTPCIASNVGGIPEWMKNNEFGYLIKPNCIDSLVKAINDILNPMTDRRLMGENGREFVLNKFSEEKFKSKIIETFKV